MQCLLTKVLLSLSLIAQRIMTCDAQQLCNDLYTSKQLKNRFSPGQLNMFCDRKTDWLHRSTSRLSDANDGLTDKQREWLNSLWSCQNLACLCKLDPTSTCKQLVTTADAFTERLGAGMPKFGGRRKRQISQRLIKLKPALRREYRMLTEDERERFHRAINTAKKQMIDGMSKYDLLTLHHTPEYCPGAHFGPALLPYHREMMKQLELLLRSIDASVSLPYWDNTLDEPLPNPADAVIWTEAFFGNGQGDVTTGPFKDWVTSNDATMAHLSPQRHIVRSLGTSQFGGLFRPDDMQRMMSITEFANLTYCVDPYFELVHGTVHMWVGGHMATLRISPNDPSFFLLHSFVDYIWEQWRQTHQTRQLRESSYVRPHQQCNSFHGFDHQMRPFRIKNRDGLLNRYTDELYHYEPSPRCTRAQPECGSPYLWCELTSVHAPRCVSKIQIGGNCTGHTASDICFHSVCRNGVCVRSINGIQPLPVIERPPDSSTRSTTTAVVSPPAPLTTPTLPNEPVNTPADPFAPLFETPVPTALTTTTTAVPRRPTTKPTRVPTIDFNIDGSGQSNNNNGFRPITQTETRRPTTTIPWWTTPTTVDTDANAVWFPITVLSVRGANVLPFRRGKIVADHADGTVMIGEFLNPLQNRYYAGAAAAKLRNPYGPGDGSVHAELTVLDENSKPCVSMCLRNAQVAPWRYNPCIVRVTLSRDPRQSDNIPFTPYLDHVLSLAWNGRRKVADPYMFLCHTSARVSNRMTINIASTRSPQPQPPPWSTTVPPRNSKTNEQPVFPPAPLSSTTTTTTERSAIDSEDDDECIDNHRCCPLWARDPGAPCVSAWMRTACVLSCHQCNRTSPSNGLVVARGGRIGTVMFRDKAECRDRFDECAGWSRKGECHANLDWMEQNCARSCDMCDRSLRHLGAYCGGSKMSAGVGTADSNCRDHLPPCALWAREGECDSNPSWMRRHCTHACKRCR